MIVLDTNVLSELLRAIPDPAVVRWTASQPLNTLFTTTVTQAEMLYGARLLASGQHRRQLEEALAALFEDDFAGRVLPFDGDAAVAYAGIAVERKRSGRPISQFDAQIAAIARSRGGYLATRNVGDFAACELHLINPWQPA
ncbi:MAG: type II toxin-antitoxin system VapC family toxin [Candidatus Accumulibacter sp.]|uniref:Ribonuclease VapC n=1 Tax=Candidatus Accumulibacter affinis TaxID=2954384 RepID=A0A935TBW2_9PROT|nr:type II toxin-antitoxin system VapC family toxin [Candidatus Accumulibacter affinis]MBP9804583.1 type II toxin-antitoxin system VapC family toxin [Accumulibacter sp.]